MTKILATRSDDDVLSGDRPSYDKAAKKFLSKRRLLARILHHLVPEFQHVSRREIEETYIVGDPLVGEVPVEPGQTNHAFPSEIRGAATEQSDDQEGTITFDVFFYAKPPKGHDSSINFYGTTERHILVDYCETPENYQLMNAIVVYIGDHHSSDNLLNLLRLIFKQDLSAEEKKKLLKQDYDLTLTEEMGEELDSMCNLSEGIFERGKENGHMEEKKQTILRLFRKGKKLSDIMDATDLSMEQIQSFLRSQNLQPAQ